MNTVYSDHRLPIYQVLGEKLRVHWNYEETEREDMEGAPATSWACSEVVFNVSVARAEFVRIVNAAGGDGDTLAEGWFD